MRCDDFHEWIKTFEFQNNDIVPTWNIPLLVIWFRYKEISFPWCFRISRRSTRCSKYCCMLSMATSMPNCLQHNTKTIQWWHYSRRRHRRLWTLSNIQPLKFHFWTRGFRSFLYIIFFAIIRVIAYSLITFYVGYYEDSITIPLNIGQMFHRLIGPCLLYCPRMTSI